MNLREAAQQALEALIEAARILGATQAKKGFGLYTSEDGRLEQVLHELLAKHSNTLRTALAEPETEAETYKRLYELRGKALERPCFHCGYKPKKIYPMEQRPEPEQEPVAWRYELATAIFESGEYTGWRCTISEKEPCAPENSIRNLQPLYTHPPQRKPLTDEEMKRVCAETFSYDPYVIARAIERAHGIGGEA
jgi:hypothetical protein